MHTWSWECVYASGGRSSSRKWVMSTSQRCRLRFNLYGWDRAWMRAGRWRLHDAHMLKLSPQPHVPLMLGLLKTNSLDNFDSTKSISVPRRVSWAFFSMNTLTPANENFWHQLFQLLVLDSIKPSIKSNVKLPLSELLFKHEKGLGKIKHVSVENSAGSGKKIPSCSTSSSDLSFSFE